MSQTEFKFLVYLVKIEKLGLNTNQPKKKKINFSGVYKKVRHTKIFIKIMQNNFMGENMQF